MSIDRDAALSEAEQLLRQGKLDGAIEAYMRLVEDRPSDWSSINTLGDLCLRAGDVERAISQFTHVADQFFVDGSLQKAAALYKKALRAQSDHEPALRQLGEIAVQQGLQADAELYLHRLAEQRQRRGDDQGAAEALARLNELKDAQARARIAAAVEGADAAHTFAGDTVVAKAADADAADTAADAIDVETADAHGAETSAVEVDAPTGEAAEGDGAVVGRDEGGSDSASVDVTGYTEVQVAVPGESTNESSAGEVEEPLHEEPSVHVAAPHEIEESRDSHAVEGEGSLEVELSGALDEITLRPADLPPDRAPSSEVGAGKRGEERLEGAVATGGGDVDLDALELAVLNLDTRFSAAAALGRHYIRRGDLRTGTRWLERALSATSDRPEEGFALKHELADALESLGESGQALTVLIDLDLDAGADQDRRARIDRLMAAQMRGAES